MFPLTRWHSVWAASCAAVGVIAAVPALQRNASPAAEPVRVTQVAVAPTSMGLASSAGGTRIYVHVTGPVARPGLYRLRPGARVMDAVTGAGGGTNNANLSLLNLAAPLRDGEKLRVPRVGDVSDPAPDSVLVRPDPLPVAAAPQPFPLAAGHAEATGKLRHPGQGVVHLNTASEGDLQRLPGVGPSTAAKIMDYRSTHNGFRNTTELLEVKGIGPKKLAKMRPFVVVP